MQAADGHLWLGTPRGLVDFDGVEFKAIGLPGQDDSRSRVITSLAPRSAGGLWVGTERGGYGAFDGTRFSLCPTRTSAATPSTVRVLQEMDDGSLFISALGATGRRLASGAEEMLSTELEVSSPARGSPRPRLARHCHRQPLLLAGRAAQSGRRAAAQLWNNQMISAVTVDKHGVIWIGAANGLHSLNPDFSPRPSIGETGQPSSLLVDRHGVLWIGSMYNGLFRYKDGALSGLARVDGLASDRVRALAESSDGSLWIGTEDGLTQLAEVKFPIYSISQGLSGDGSLA